jgi:hypothetical protein
VRFPSESDRAERTETVGITAKVSTNLISDYWVTAIASAINRKLELLLRNVNPFATCVTLAGTNKFMIASLDGAVAR